MKQKEAQMAFIGRFSLLLGVSLAAFCGQLQGQECADLNSSPGSTEEATVMLADLAVEKCLGGSGKPCLEGLDDVCRAVDALEAIEVDPDRPETDEELVEAFKLLPPELMSALPPAGPEELALRREIRRQFAGFLERGDAAVARARYQPNGLVFFAGGNAEVDLGALIAVGCPGSCTEAFRRAARFYTIASLYRRSLGKLLQAERDATLAYLEGLENRWEAYFSGAYSQYPWELALNSWRYKRSPGLAEPPTRQLILGHPGIAYEVVDQEDETVLRDALTVELLGFYRWRFKDDKVRRPFGASLVVAWHGSVGDDVGYGVLVHLPRSWSLGFSYRDDTEFSALISADLGKLFANRAGVYEKVFE